MTSSSQSKLRRAQLLARNKVEEIWRSQVFGWVLLFAFSGIYTYWRWQVPAPGKSVAMLAAVAAVVTFRTDIKGGEKFFWSLLMIAFLTMEFRSIDKDRADHDRDQTQARKEEHEAFTAIVGGIRTSIENSQKQFDETIRQTKSVMLNVTGGTSYAVVMPTIFTYEKNVPEVPLAIENHGAHPLTGVSVTIYKEGIWIAGTKESILQSVANRINVGTLHAGERLVLSVRLRPEQLMSFDEEDGSGHAFRGFIYIAGQNFTSAEFLDFRKATDGHWQFKYKIYRQNPVFPRKPRPETMLEQIDWSEDMNSLVPKQR